MKIIIKKIIIKKICKIYLIATSILFSIFITLVVTNEFKILHEETGEIMGHTSRPTVNGQVHTLIVGDKSSNGDVIIYGEVQVQDFNNHKIGDEISYKIWRPPLYGNPGWGYIEK